MENVVIIAAVLLVVGGAVIYIIKEKKRGAACIGCPYAGQCSAHKKQGCCTQENPVEPEEQK